MAEEITNFVGDGDEELLPQAAPGDKEPEDEQSEAERNLVKRIQATIRTDKEHFKTDFAQMRLDMFVAKYGRIPDYPKEHYKVNLAGRHVKQKTAYEITYGDWSSDVCSSDLKGNGNARKRLRFGYDASAF